jgi:hypothetical protein
MKLALTAILALLLSSTATAGIIHSLSHTENEYTYNNGHGQHVTGHSIAVDGMDLEWLPTSMTIGHKWNNVKSLSNLMHNTYQGWRLATTGDILTMVDSLISTETDLHSDQNDHNIRGMFDYFSSYFGGSHNDKITGVFNNHGDLWSLNVEGGYEYEWKKYWFWWKKKKVDFDSVYLEDTDMSFIPFNTMWDDKDTSAFLVREISTRQQESLFGPCQGEFGDCQIPVDETDLQPVPVSSPGTVLLMGLGLVLLGMRARLKK